MKLANCPVCNGDKEYIIEVANIKYPVNCTFCGGEGKVPKSATYSGVRKG